MAPTIPWIAAGVSGFRRLARNRWEVTELMETSVRFLAIFPIMLFAAEAAAEPVRSTEQIGDETFEVWHQAGDDFRMYCNEPCAADDEAIRTFYATFRSHLPELIDWHGVDVVEELKPIEIHLNESAVCPALSGAAGYAEVSYHRDGDSRGLNCLFEVERGADTLADRTPVLALHEYAHLILFERHRYSYEYFTYWSSWAVYDPEHEFADPCSSFYETFYATGTVHALCERFGLEQEHVREALIELDRRYRNDEGFLPWWSAHGFTTSLAELRGVLDALLEADTAAAWLVDWPATQVGTEFTIGPDAARYEAVEGRIVIDAPASALPEARAMRLDRPNSSWGFLPFTHSPRHFAIVAEGDTSNPFAAAPIEFEVPVTIGFEPEPFYLATQPLETYTILEQRGVEGGEPYWRSVPGTRFDPETGRVTASIERSGHYAYGPAFRAPAGMFYDPAFDGHGFDIQMSGDEVFALFFTYERDGEPLWLIGNAPLGNVEGRSLSAVEMTLSRVERDPASGSLGVDPAGRLFLQFYGGWNARGWRPRARAEVELDGITDGTVEMDLEQLAFGDSRDTALQVTGHWFAPDDSGWGLTIDRKGSTEVNVAYFYDSAGRPRWAIGTRAIDEPETALTTVDGYCLGCEVVETVNTPAGGLTLDFEADGRSALADLEVAWPPQAADAWARIGAAIAPLSNPPVYRVDPNGADSALEIQSPAAPAGHSASDTEPPFECATPRAGHAGHVPALPEFVQ
jgi:hypothetical protein